MTTEKLIPIVSEVLGMDEVDLCIICCSKVKQDSEGTGNNITNCSLLSSSLTVYLMRKVLQLNDNELKKDLIDCGIRLCDKCSALTRQAERLHQRLILIERDLNCVHQLIKDKASRSINCEHDRKLVEEEETIDLTKKNNYKNWRRIRNVIGNKFKSTSTPTSPDIKIEDDDFGVKLEEELDEEDDVSGSSHEEANQDTLTFTTSTTYLEEMDQESEDQEVQLKDEVEENAVDCNWEPDEDDEDGEEDDSEDEETEVDQEETISFKGKRSLEDCEVKSTEKRRKSVKYTENRKSKVRGEEEEEGPSRSKTCQKTIRTEDGRFKCRHCDQTFSKTTGVNGHERAKHFETPGAFVCDICGEAFNSRDYLRKHTRRKHEMQPKYRKSIRTPDGKYLCRYPDCGRKFGSADGCIAHEREKHPKTPGAFICDICGRACNSAYSLRGHLNSHKLKSDGTPRKARIPKSLQSDPICDQCGKKYPNGSELRKHIKFSHEKAFNFKCEICGVGRRSSNALKKHMFSIHAGEVETNRLREEEGLELWRCPVKGCSLAFLNGEKVKGHLKRKHGKGEGEVEGLDAGVVSEDPKMKATCEKCGKVFWNRKSLKGHMVVHENEGKDKEYFCDKCGNGFVSEKYLEHHVKYVHLEKERGRGKEFKCDICGKGFEKGYSLKEHLKMHEGKRDYFCERCGHGFVMERHLRTHQKRTSCGRQGEQGEEGKK